MTSPKLRALAVQDVPALLELMREHAIYEHAAWPSRDREPGLKHWFLGDGPARCWVVEADKTLVGFASVNLELSSWDAAGYLHLDCLYIREGFRGRGLGRQLMACVAREALERRAVNLQWQTPEWNVDALRFYERLGATHSKKYRFTLEGSQCRSLVDGTASSAD